MGRCKSLGSLKSSLWYAPQLSRDSILNPLRVHSLGWLQWLVAWWPQHPLFTDMAGNIFCPQYFLASREKNGLDYSRKYHFVPRVLNVFLYSANLNTLGRRILDPSRLCYLNPYVGTLGFSNPAPIGSMYTMKISFRNEGDIKTFSGEGKLRKFTT